MILRQKFAIGGAAAGVAYTAFGLYAAYWDGSVPTTKGEIALQFFVFSIFTVPFAAMIGFGIGLIAEGIAHRLKSQ